MIDSHCHLQSLTPEDCDRALDQARAAGVRGFLVPAISLDDYDRVLELCERERDVWCALGIHPHQASKAPRGWEKRLAGLLAETHVVAVGECGLDFHYDFAPEPEQVGVMETQWRLAIDADLPVVVHNRESNAAMQMALRKSEFSALRGVFHSFAGGREFAAELVERGLFIGISGMVTFPRADNIREMVSAIPQDHLLVETDTPYLAPVPYRGRSNEPAYVIEVVDRLAREVGIARAMMAERTTENFFALFPGAVRQQ